MSAGARIPIPDYRDQLVEHCWGYVLRLDLDIEIQEGILRAWEKGRDPKERARREYALRFLKLRRNRWDAWYQFAKAAKEAGIPVPRASAKRGSRKKHRKS